MVAWINIRLLQAPCVLRTFRHTGYSSSPPSPCPISAKTLTFSPCRAAREKTSPSKTVWKPLLQRRWAAAVPQIKSYLFPTVLGRRCSFHSGRHGPRFFSDFCLNLKKMYLIFFSFFFFYDFFFFFPPWLPPGAEGPGQLSCHDCRAVRPQKQTNRKPEMVRVARSVSLLWEEDRIPQSPPLSCRTGLCWNESNSWCRLALLSGCSVRNCHFFFFFNEKWSLRL